MLNTGLAIITVILSLLAIAKVYGEDRGGNAEWRKAVDDRLVKHDKYHEEHYQHAKDDQKHFQDTEMHWNSRQRDELGQKLDRIFEEIRSLHERMYGDKK